MLARKRVSAAAALLIGVSVAQVQGNVNLELRPVSPVYRSGETVEIGLYAVSDDATNQLVRAMNVILTWDPAHLELLGVDNNGPHPWMMSGFFADSELDGLNADCAPDVYCDPYTGLPFNDGDAYYQAVGAVDQTAEATPEGLLVTTLLFQALQLTPSTQVNLPSDVGGVVQTGVAGNPGENVTGTLSPTEVRIDPAVDWGDLTVVTPTESCGAQLGETVTVLLDVSNLEGAVNGVQALLDFDDTLLMLTDVLPGDGAGSPWDNPAVQEVHGQTGDGTTYVVVIWPGGGSGLDATVARIQFTALFDGTPPTVPVSLVTQSNPLITEFTLAATAESVVPTLHGPAIIGQPGDGDADGDVDTDDSTAFMACYTGPGNQDPLGACCVFDFDRDSDVDCDDWDAFLLVWTGPGEPPTLTVCLIARPLADSAFDIQGNERSCTTDEDCIGSLSPASQTYCVLPPAGAPGPGTCYVQRNRYVSIDPNPANSGNATARRVSLDLGGGQTVVLGWVGEPTPLVINGPETSPQLLSRIVDEANRHYRDWNVDNGGQPWADSTVHLGSCETSPGNAYLIQSIGEGADITDEANYSDALRLLTVADFGDVVGASVGEPPDAIRNFKDVSAEVRGFQGIQTEPKVWLDLRGGVETPELPDFSDINFNDINLAVAGFQGADYVWAGPCECPGQTCP